MLAKLRVKKIIPTGIKFYNVINTLLINNTFNKIYVNN